MISESSFLWFLDFRSDIPIQIWDVDGFMNGEGLRTHAIVRDGGHYYGNCIAFDPPDMAPVGMDNKVCTKQLYIIAFKNHIKGHFVQC